MATKKKAAKKKKAPHCKVQRNPDGSTKKTAAGKVKKMCFDGSGKITSEAKVKQYRAKQRSKAS